MRHLLADSLTRPQLLADLDPTACEQLATKLEPVRLQRGQTLFREGEVGTDLFVIDSGEVRVLTEGGVREICRLGPGCHVGEMALIDAAPRSATIVAGCDALLWRLTRKDFEQFAAQHPEIHRQIALVLAQRLREADAHVAPRRHAAAVLIVDARSGPRGDDDLTHVLLEALQQTTGCPARVLRLDSTHGTPTPGPNVEMVADPERLGGQVDNLLRTHRHVLLVATADRADEPRLRAASGRADLTIVVTDAESESLEQVRRVLDGMRRQMSPEAPPVELAVDRRRLRSRLDFRSIDQLAGARPVHALGVAPGYPGTGPPEHGGVGRLARRIARQRVGLALGGGGARAFAHIGVLAVLERERIPVDVLAGSSGGAIVAGLMARDWDSSQIAEFLRVRWTRRRVLDFRLPWTSLLRGRKLERIGLEAGQGLTLQELSRPFVAVATDLVTGQEVRLRRGDGWTAVRASLAVPGLFPPVRVGTRYLVDGAALDSMPAAAAREAGADVVIGIDVRPPLEPAFLPPSASSVQEGPFGRFMRSFRAGPPLARIVYRTITAQGEALQTSHRLPDFTLKPDVAEYDMFGFDDFHAIADRGRAAADACVAELRRLTCCTSAPRPAVASSP